jgi:hypothetical protein
MRKTATVLTALGIVEMLAAAVPAPAQTLLAPADAAQTANPCVVADLWLRQVANDQNLDGDHTTYYVSVYWKLGPQAEEHHIVGPRPIGEWRVVNNKSVGPSIADRLIQARFSGDIRYVIRITHGDGNARLPDNPAVEFALDAGNHVIALVPEAMQCSATPDRQPGISLTGPAHTWLWITVEEAGLSQPQIATC